MWLPLFILSSSVGSAKKRWRHSFSASICPERHVMVPHYRTAFWKKQISDELKWPWTGNYLTQENRSHWFKSSFCHKALTEKNGRCPELKGQRFLKEGWGQQANIACIQAERFIFSIASAVVPHLQRLPATSIWEVTMDLFYSVLLQE